jgi:DNA-binding Lrp family transcriptional regulator
MSKTILAEVDGWTPIIDSLASKHGVIRAAVFGRIWRYCQGEQGKCTASLETIAKDLGINKATVMRHAKQLVEDGYLKDLTPELRNVPHAYADTGKAGIILKITASEAVAESNATVAQCNATVAESKLKRQVKRQVKKDSDPRTSSSEVVMFLHIVGHNPSKEHYDDVIKALAGKTPEEVTAVYERWCKSTTKSGAPYNPNSYGWLDWLQPAAPKPAGWAQAGKPAEKSGEPWSGFQIRM